MSLRPRYNKQANIFHKAVTAPTTDSEGESKYRDRIMVELRQYARRQEMEGRVHDLLEGK